MGFRAGSDVLEQKNLFSLPGFEPRTVQTAAYSSETVIFYACVSINGTALSDGMSWYSEGGDSKLL